MGGWWVAGGSLVGEKVEQNWVLVGENCGGKYLAVGIALVAKAVGVTVKWRC